MATITEALAEAYASAPVDEIIYDTLEIHHPSFTVPIRVVRDFAELIATLEPGAPRDAGVPVTFVPFAFDLVPPEQTGVSLPVATIEIDNTSLEIMAAVEGAMASTDLLTCIYRQFIASDLSAPQNDPPLELTIFSINANVFRVRATAGYGDLPNKRFPGVDYTSEVFPGLIPA